MEEKQKLFSALFLAWKLGCTIAFLSMFFWLGAGHCLATETKDYAVQLSAVVETSPAKITLNWVQDTNGAPTSYAISRKLKEGSSWTLLDTVSGSTLTYDDNNVTAGSAYEYQVDKTATGYHGYGYIFVGIDVPIVDDRGKVILLVDDTFSDDLADELSTLEEDLVGDGWSVLRHDVSRTDTVPNIKSVISSDYNTDPEDVKSVYILGHLPVPYSGSMAPDGHSDHWGAWPADFFYGDMDGTWADTTVNHTEASDERNWNVPGDGKYDETYYRYSELEVGRVDFYNMPSLPGSPTELELMRQYLEKDHDFRHKDFDFNRQGLIGDNFGIFSGEAFAASGWRNFSAFFGSSNIDTAGADLWIQALTNDTYLWAYGCGGGSYTSANGIGTTNDIYSNDPQAAFYMIFGSYFGDWDTQNNFLRAPLAAPSYGLASMWAGRPHWFVHHMGLGETIGYGAKLTQRNPITSPLYKNQSNASPNAAHIALMGDPTLRMHIVAPASGLAVRKTGSDNELSWTASSDSVEGYHVYRATNANGPFSRLTSDFVTGTSYEDENPAAGNFTYIVKAIKKENTASGTYYNSSQGIFATTTDAPILTEITPINSTTFDATPNYTFSSTEAGTITYSGSCSSATTSAVTGTNTITFNELSPGMYSDCTIKVTDSSLNESELLNVSEFTIELEDMGTPSLSVDGESERLKSSQKLYSTENKVKFEGTMDSLIGGTVKIFSRSQQIGTASISEEGKWSDSVRLGKNKTYEIKFKYYNSSSELIGESRRYKIKVDTKKPKFSVMPAVLNKRRGAMVWWQATDNDRIKRYKYVLNGKNHYTTRKYFHVPADTPVGLHTLRLSAYDKAGNKATQVMKLRILR